MIPKRHHQLFEELTWEQYKANREQFGHIASWGLWSDELLTIKANDLDAELPIRKELYLAETAEEFYAKGLNIKLNKNMVLLALNFSGPQTLDRVKENDKIGKILATYNANYQKTKFETPKDAKQRYLDLKALAQSDPKYLFFNGWKAAGKGTKTDKQGTTSGYYRHFQNPNKPDYVNTLSGAYFTDLIKFEKDPEGNLVSCGISQSDSTNNKVTQYLKGEKLAIQIQGLREELDSLGIVQPHFILLHSALRRKRVTKALKQAFGEQTFIDYIPHYSPQQQKKTKTNELVDTFHEMYESYIDDLVKALHQHYQ